MLDIGLFLFASVSVADPVPRPWGRERGPGAGLTLGQLGPPSPADSKSHQSAVHLQRNLAGLTYK